MPLSPSQPALDLSLLIEATFIRKIFHKMKSKNKLNAGFKANVINPQYFGLWKTVVSNGAAM